MKSYILFVILKDLREAFRIFDKDKSGYIDGREIILVTSTLGQALSQEELEAFMAEADLEQIKNEFDRMSIKMKKGGEQDQEIERKRIEDGKKKGQQVPTRDLAARTTAPEIIFALATAAARGPQPGDGLRLRLGGAPADGAGRSGARRAACVAGSGGAGAL